MIFFPFILIDYLRNYTGICVHTSSKGVEGKQLEEDENRCEELRVKSAIEEIVG
jgi:hypothetical protein